VTGRRVLAVVGGAALLACPGTQRFACRDNADCDREAGGVCLDDDACAYPVDPSVCPSGLQRSSTADEPGACVEPEAADGGTSSTGAGGATTTGSVETGSGSGSDGRAASSTGSLEPVTDEVVATIAECLVEGTPDPAACEETVPFGRLVVDGNPPPARTAYLRFDFEQTIDADAVQEVRLQLTVPDCEPCEGERPGDVYGVEAFELEDLSMAPPEIVDFLVEGMGPVVRDEVIEIVLPADRLFPADRVHLALVPTTANEVHFFNTRGLEPPVLVVVRDP